MTIKREIEQKNIPFLGSIEYDDEIEKAIGETKKLLSTRFAADLDKAIKRTDF